MNGVVKVREFYFYMLLRFYEFKYCTQVVLESFPPLNIDFGLIKKITKKNMVFELLIYKIVFKKKKKL